MLLDLLEDPHEIRRICIMGRNCTLNKGNDAVECSVPLDKQIADGKLFKGIFFVADINIDLSIVLMTYNIASHLIFSYESMICRGGGGN